MPAKTSERLPQPLRPDLQNSEGQFVANNDRLITQHQSRVAREEAAFFYAGMIRHWRILHPDCLGPIKSSGEKMLERGKILEGHLALIVYFNYSFILSKPLPKLLQEIQVYQKLALHHQSYLAVHLYDIYIQAFLNLMKKSHDDDLYQKSTIESNFVQPGFERDTDELCLYTMGIFEGFKLILFKNYGEAFKKLKTLTPPTQPLSGIYDRIFYFYCLTLATLGVCAKTPASKQKKYIKEAQSYLKIIKKAALQYPENYEKYYELCEAETQHLQRNTSKAIHHFQKSIDVCHKHNCYWLEAISSEYFASFWLNIREKSAASIFSVRARNLYLSWGSLGKAKTNAQEQSAAEAPLGDSISDSLKARSLATISSESQQGDHLQKPASQTINNSFQTQNLDGITLIQASQTLSSHMDLRNLLKTLLHLALTHSEATNGFLALASDQNITNSTIKNIIVRMIGHSRFLEDIEATNLPIENYLQVAPIIKKVIQSKENFIVDDSFDFSDDLFKNSVDASFNPPRSLVCLPILDKGDLVAILWLENKQLPKSFVEDDLLFLKILLTQAAISIKNAQYLEELTQKARLEGDVTAAEAVQNSLLPHTKTPPEASIALYYKAAEKMGGDWATFECDRLRNRLYLCIGDVTGHGIPSALLTAAAAGAVKSVLWGIIQQNSDQSLPECLESIAMAVNKTVCDIGNPVDRSMTMVFVAVDLSTGNGAFINAGHLPILHLTGDLSTCLSCPGPLLGIEKDPIFAAHHFKMTPGDRLFLYTDGLTENQGPQGQPLRYLELRKILRKNESPSEASDAILSKLLERWGQILPEDDCTYMIFRWNHAAPKASTPSGLLNDVKRLAR